VFIAKNTGVCSDMLRDSDRQTDHFLVIRQENFTLAIDHSVNAPKVSTLKSFSSF
jgi:hypothetical protein